MNFSFHALLLNDLCMLYVYHPVVNQGPVVQSIVSLTTLLRRQFVKYMPTTLSNPLLFFVENVRIFCTAKDSHIFPTKNNIGFVILTF